MSECVIHSFKLEIAIASPSFASLLFDKLCGEQLFVCLVNYVENLLFCQLCGEFFCLVNCVENNCAKLDTFLCCASVSEKMIGKKKQGCKRTLQRYTAAEHTLSKNQFYDNYLLNELNRRADIHNNWKKTSNAKLSMNLKYI